jgi:biopolymer transport protein ExbB/TolQ
MSLPALHKRAGKKSVAGIDPGAPAKKRGYPLRQDLVWMGIGFVFLLIIGHLPMPDRVASLLLDTHFDHITHARSTPVLSIHTINWTLFFICFGRLLFRWREAGAEERELQREYLPPEDDIILTGEDLGQLYQTLRATPTQRFLPRLLERTVAQYQGNKSVSHAHTLLDSCLDLYLHELDLGYHMIRYIVWLIPTIGFIGSVIGIGGALAVAGATKADDPNLLADTTSAMSIAFNGTFIALLLSAVLVYMMHIAQQKEEAALNGSAQYCLDKLINRLLDAPGKAH